MIWERERERERERGGERVGSAGEQLWRLSNRKSVTACDSVSMHTTQKYIRNGRRVDERSDSMHHPSFFFTRNPPLVCLPHPPTFNKTNLPCFHSDHAGFVFIDMWWCGAMEPWIFSHFPLVLIFGKEWKWWSLELFLHLFCYSMILQSLRSNYLESRVQKVKDENFKVKGSTIIELNMNHLN